LNAIILDTFHIYGYSALWFIIFIAAVGAPISGNMLLYAAGAFAAFGQFNIFVLFLVAVSAAVLGDNLGYFIGWKMGAPLLIWLETQKRFHFITPKAIENSRAYFRKRAGMAIFLTRFLILVLGGPLNWLAGVERYSYRRFLFWDISGQVLGAIIPLSIGYIFATSWGKVERALGAFSSIILAALACIFVAVLVIRKIRSHKQAQKDKENEQLSSIEDIAETSSTHIEEHTNIQINTSN
jgi:membrane-associated protein